LPVVKERHDVHQMVKAEFGNLWVSIFYILFVACVAFHLNHAIQSAFHTLGVEGPKFSPTIRVVSILLAITLFLLFTSIPLAVTTYSLLNCLGIDFCFMNCLVGGGCL